MIIVYAPEGGDTHRWDLKQVRILATEAEAVERVTDLEWETARAKVVKGSMRALRAVAWVLMKRTDTTLRYTQFAPAASELSYEFDAEERAAIRSTIENDADLSDDEKAAVLADFDEMDAALDAEEPAADEVPKASADEASPTAA